MNSIARWFLRAKHWQIFLFFCVAFLIANVAMINFEMSEPASMLTFPGDLPFFIVWILCMCFFLGWLWSMGPFLSFLLQPPLQRKMRFFIFSLIYPAIYGLFFIATFSMSTTKPVILAIIFPLHFLAMFCIFYDLYFVSKALIQVETGKSATFYDYAGPFFLLWFFPVGVWFTQPRINHLYHQHRAVVES
jgi:hypothetical protein